LTLKLRNRLNKLKKAGREIPDSQPAFFLY
jgi:hypothetical protein